MLGKDMVERLVQDDIRMQTELEAKKQKEQMPKKISDRIPWAKERSEEYNAQIKKNKAKYRTIMKKKRYLFIGIKFTVYNHHLSHSRLLPEPE